MDNKDLNQFIDDLLDAGLARYSNVTPRPGLEGRMLANVRAERERNSWFLWAGMLAAGAVAAIIVVGVFDLARSIGRPASPLAATTRQSAPQVVASLPAVEPALPPPPSRQAAKERVPRIVAETARQETRLDVFPSPQPMTEQEKLLLEYVRRNSPEVLSASAADSTAIQEVKIKELRITPLVAEQNETQLR
jgi:hypothetical protein